MNASRFSSARVAVAAVAGALILSSAAYAQNDRYQQILPQGAYGQGSYGAAHQGARAHYRSAYPSSTPSDYVSSHVCINGYRYITRETDRWDNPAQNAIPVRC